jgi:stage V sporulation protein G
MKGAKTMQITNVRIVKIDGDDRLKAIASVVFDDCFLVSDLRVVENDDGFFVAMPSKRKRDGSFKDIAYPLNNDFRQELERKVLLAFESVTETRAISRLESGESQTVRPDLLSVEEFGFQPKPSN